MSVEQAPVPVPDDERLTVGRLVSLNVGLPKDVPWRGRTVHTGVWKHPVDGPRMVRTLNIDGDGQGDLGGHGGPHRAVLVYQLASYAALASASSAATTSSTGSSVRTSPSTGLPTTRCASVTGIEIGAALFEVSQPRVTCYRVGLRLGEPRLPALLVATGDRGSTCGCCARASSRPATRSSGCEPDPERMTVADVDALLYLPGHDRAERCPGAAHRGAESRLAGILRGPAGHRSRAPTGNVGLSDAAEPAGRVAGFPAGAGRRRGHRERDGGLAAARLARRRAVAGGAAGTVRRPAPQPGDGAAADLPQLFALRAAGIARLPGQRET